LFNCSKKETEKSKKALYETRLDPSCYFFFKFTDSDQASSWLNEGMFACYYIFFHSRILDSLFKGLYYKTFYRVNISAEL
jgi:hypothetical protein